MHNRLLPPLPQAEAMLDWLPVSVKSRLHQQYYGVRTAYFRYFHPYSADDLLSALRKLGVVEGDVVLAHSSLAAFVGFRGGAPEVIKVLEDAVGPSGTLIMPTLSFSGSAVAYARQGKIFDPKRSPSQVGLLTEVFRRSKGVARSLHPTHSVAVLGPDADYFVRDHHLAGTPCGAGTPFCRLWEKNGKVLLLGVGVSAVTFFHCVEELLEKELPFSPFTSELFTMKCKVDGSIVETAPMRLYDPGVSARRELSVLEDALRKRGAWRQGKLGNLQLIVLKAADILSATRDLANQGIYCYRKARA